MQELGDALITLPPGLETAHASLHQLVIYPLLYSRLLDKLNIQSPRGILLHGVPGVGKTMLVRNLAKELRVGLVVIQGPDYFGADGDERLRKKFLDAEKEADKKGCILFIDEIVSLKFKEIRLQKYYKLGCFDTNSEEEQVKPRSKNNFITSPTNR